MKPLLCVHQGTELYGSDRSFVHAVAALAGDGGRTVEILLPGAGAISSLIAQAGLADPVQRHLWVLRKSGLARAMTLGLPRNLSALISAVGEFRRRDTVYVNTAVVLDFIVAAMVTRRRLIVHVREIPTGVSRIVLRRLLVLAQARVIFNSHATAAVFDLPAEQPQRVVYNGYPEPIYTQRAPYAGRPLRVLCIGRLNAWKGQDVLISACAGLPEHLRDRLDVRIVGGVYGAQHHFRTRLEDAVSAAGLNGMVRLAGEVDDPMQEYRDAGIVVVPSTRPEPFGRVAIEAMAHGCAVLASDHGGLREIVCDGETGLLLPPGSPEALTAALEQYLAKPETVAQHGEAGRVRFRDYFTQEASNRSFLQAFQELEAT